MAAILTTKEDAQGVEENIDPKNTKFYTTKSSQEEQVNTIAKYLECLNKENPGIFKVIKQMSPQGKKSKKCQFESILKKYI